MSIAEKAIATHSSTLAWEIPWTEEPGRLRSMGSRRLGHDFTFTFHFHALASPWPGFPGDQCGNKKAFIGITREAEKGKEKSSRTEESWPLQGTLATGTTHGCPGISVISSGCECWSLCGYVGKGPELWEMPACQCRRCRFDPWLGRSPGGTPLQYSCLETPMDGGAW